jgi:CheY-like chemotaxis protein
LCGFSSVEVGLGETHESPQRGLVLLIDHDVMSRRGTRHLLESRGLDVVQASNGMAALELVQRLPDSFQLVLADLQLPGIPGRVIMETLRIFRPRLPVYCMSTDLVVAATGGLMGCLSKPLLESELDATLREIADGWSPPTGLELPEELIARARSRFAASGDLVEAALELSRGTPELGGR